MSLQTLRRSRTRPPLRLVLVAAGVVALVIVAVWALFFSSWFTVQDVEVEGASVLAPEEVLAAAAVRSDAPLIRLDGDAVAERVRALAPVDDVSVSRHWPHTVVITVVERQPALVVPSDQGFTLYDDEGVGYLDVIAAPEGVPVLSTAEPDELTITGVLEMLGALPEPVRARLAAVRAETPDSIELDLADGVVVVWGSADQSPRKAEVLVALMKQPATVYNVSAPEAPAIRP